MAGPSAEGDDNHSYNDKGYQQIVEQFLLILAGIRRQHKCQIVRDCYILHYICHETVGFGFDMRYVESLGDDGDAVVIRENGGLVGVFGHLFCDYYFGYYFCFNFNYWEREVNIIRQDGWFYL